MALKLLLGLVVLVLLFMLFPNDRLDARRKKIISFLKRIASREPRWSDLNLMQVARREFEDIQRAWAKGDLKRLEEYLHPEIFEIWKKTLEESLRRADLRFLHDFIVQDVALVEARNYKDDSRDEFSAAIKYFGEIRSSQKVRAQETSKLIKSGEFQEFWTFRWSGGHWTLRKVTAEKDSNKLFSSPLIDER